MEQWFPQETDPDLPVSVQESLAEVWVDSAYHGVRGTEYTCAGITTITPTIVWPQDKQQGGNTPTHQQKIGLKIYWTLSCKSEQDPDSPTASPSYQEVFTSLWLLSTCSVQFSHSVMSDFDPMNCSRPGHPDHHQLLELTQTHVWVGDAIQPSHLCWPLLLPPSISPSIRVFSNESVLHIR